MLIGSKAIGTVGIMAGVPAVLTNFCRSLVKMMIFTRESVCSPTQYIHYDEAPFSDHGPARNHLVANMVGDWLLMLDTDHEFEPDLLVRMLKRFEGGKLDVMTAIYRFRANPCSPVLYAKNPDDGMVKAIATYPGNAIFKVDAAGAGCLLVRRSVFEAIEAMGENSFDRLPGLSEDHSFFRRLEKLGINSWCDSRIECHHLRVEPVTRDDEDVSTIEHSEPFAVMGRL